MALDWSVHTCTYFCQGGIHAVPILALPATPVAMIATALRLGLDPAETLVEIRPAHEADVPLWHVEFGDLWTGWNQSGRVCSEWVGVPAAMSTPYLAFIYVEGPPCEPGTDASQEGE